MRTKHCVMVIFAFSLSFLGCKSPEEKAADKKFVDGELARMQGQWKITSQEGAEEADVKIDGAGLEIAIEDGVLQRASNGKVETRQKLTILPRTDPVQVDLVYLNEDGAPMKTSSEKKVTRGKNKDKMKVTRKTLKHKGIYKLEGDKLQIAWSWEDGKRPTDFTPESGVYVLSLVKVKNGKEEKKTNKDSAKNKDDKTKEKKEKDEEK